MKYIKGEHLECYEDLDLPEGWTNLSSFDDAMAHFRFQQIHIWISRQVKGIPRFMVNEPNNEDDETQHFDDFTIMIDYLKIAYGNGDEGLWNISEGLTQSTRDIESVQHIWDQGHDRWIYIERYRDDDFIGLNFMQGDEYETFKESWGKVDMYMSNIYQDMKDNYSHELEKIGELEFMNKVFWTKILIQDEDLASDPTYHSE